MVENGAAERDFVLRSARENDVKFVRLWFTDILGNLKGFTIDVDDLEDAIEQGVGFDGTAIEGFARIGESDMRAFPDPSTFAVLPWRPRQNAVARMFCDIRTPSGEPFIGDPGTPLSETWNASHRPGSPTTSGLSWSISTSETPIPPSPWTSAGTLTSSPASPLTTCAGTPCSIWPTWAYPSNTRTTKGRPASTR